MLASNQIVTPSFDKQLGKEQLALAQERNELLTVKEVAELLRVPVSWVYDRTRKRSLDRLPGIRLGKYWRFRQA
jgi:excisionase family DNA binding protein